MSKKLPTPILHKFIFQAVYKPNLKFYDLLYSATQKLRGYGHWETNRLYVFLHDYEKHCTLAVRHNIFSYEWDYSGTKYYIDDVRETLDILPTSLELKSFERVGFRKQYLIPTPMSFEEINNILTLKFLAQDEQLTGLFSSGVTDMTYVAAGMDDELRCHIAVAPMKRQEISNHIKVNQKYNFDPNRPEDYGFVLSNYPKISIYLDIEVSHRDEETGIPKDYLLNFLERSDTLVQEKLSYLNKYIFAK